MNLEERLSWFKTSFGSQIKAATEGSPISVDLIAAIALQETGYLWSSLIKHHNGDIDGVLAGCVGDTLDHPKRRAFPINREQLAEHPKGETIFGIARSALSDLADIHGTYRRVFERDQNKFCRGYGILQYDLQHLQTDPDFFLETKWASFEQCLQKCLVELRRGISKRGYDGRNSLTLFEAATVAIVYNRGRYDPVHELRQGHRDSSGRFYGEYIYDYLKMSSSVDAGNPHVGDEVADEMLANYIVNARGGLNLRGGPGTHYEILATLDLGREINVVSFVGSHDRWALVDLEGDGKLDGFVFGNFLDPIESDDPASDNVEDELRRQMLTESGMTAGDSFQDSHEECQNC
jgi:hypothetical protein